MANEARAFGFRPVQTRDGSPWCGKTMTVLIKAADTAAFFNGDMVVHTGEQVKHHIDSKFYEVVTALSGTVVAGELAGAITGILAHQDPNLLYTGYRPAGAQSTDILVEIPVDRNVIYVAQEDSVGGALAQDSNGGNVGFVVGTGDPATRMSGSLIDSSSINTTDTLPLRLMSYDGTIDNESGEFALWYCTINTDPYSNKTGV